MKFRSGINGLILAMFVGLLSACDSSEERAEKYFQSALKLLKAGDEERAIVEFRNVFKLNGLHHDARVEFASLQRKRGNYKAAAGQYLRLVEQFPDDFDGNLAIAELYAEIGNWEGMETYLATATKLKPDDPVVSALQVVFDYRQLVKSEDYAAAKSMVAQAQELQEGQPENKLLRQVIIDAYLREKNYDAALKELDAAIELSPADRRLYTIRLSILAALQDPFAIEAQLKDMITRFPEDETSRARLVRWFVSQNQLDEAENYLREAAEKGDSKTEDVLVLVRFLSQLRGADVALAELEKIVSSGGTDPLLIALAAGFQFDAGDQNAAIEKMQNLILGMEPNEESAKIKLALSQMLETTGNSVGARVLVEEILETDQTNADALKRKATWLIDGDQVSEAILALRSALDQTPQDAEILTLLASAHERGGNTDLVGEMLALAFDVSNKAPAESVRYASFLIQQKNFSTAESVLVDALRLAPGQLSILRELGQVYVRSEDWPRAEQVQATMARLDSTRAKAASNDLKTRILQGQQKLDEAASFLESLARDGSAGFGAHVAIVRNHLATGNVDKAQSYVSALVADNPDSAEVQFLDASVDAASGANDRAATKFRSLVDADQSNAQMWIALYRVLLAANRPDEAEDAVDQGRIALPNDPALKWVKAGILEGKGDLQGAIDIYEDMYAIDSQNLIIANNLASLLSNLNDDPDTIERANVISRRLRTSKVAPFQDTYGWVAFLRGEIAVAIEALEPAAEGLKDDPLVQFHLAQAYAADRNDAGALSQYLKVLALTGEADTRDFVEISRQEINRLKTASE